MLIRTGLGGQLSGSTGGVVASRNRYGQYLRNRTVPVNPQSARQQVTRAAFAAASVAWQQLSENEREQWKAYADGTPVLNKLGESVILSPNAMFCRAFAYAGSVGLVPEDYTTAPASPGLCSLGSVNITAITLSVASGFPAQDTNQGITAELYAVQIGPPLSAGAAYPGSRFTLLGTAVPIEEAVPTPANVPFGSLVVGQRRPIRLTGITSQGKLANPVIGIITVTA